MTMQPSSARRDRVRSERGAVAVQAAVAIFVLTAFGLFVVDYGVLWVSRSQAQNAADSGALAGATALALDDFANHEDDGPAKQAAHRFATINTVFGEQPTVDLATDVRFYGDDASVFPASCADDSCVRVDVYRNQARGNPLPTIFGWLVGLTDHGVRATATGQAAAANASECLKPWAIADRWRENNPVPGAEWTAEATFDPTGPRPDVYIPPSAGSTSTSFKVESDLGLELVLKTGNPKDTIHPGWFQALDLSSDGENRGAATYEDAIRGCVKKLWEVGDDIPKENGNMVGPTKHGAEDLIALDPDATWNGDEVVGSCVGPPYSCDGPGYTHSPRIVALPVFDIAEYMRTGGPGKGTVHVVNILGFFVDRMDGNDVVGYLARKPDLKSKTGGTVAPEVAFLWTIQLVR
jgi:Flp pilus assembly protein TadG